MSRPIAAVRQSRLAPADVWVWHTSLAEAPLDTSTPMLSTAETERAARYRRPADRSRFVVGRAGLRRLLADVLGRPPHTLAFSFGPLGKPALLREPGDADVRFSISHAGDAVVWAVTRGRAVGVDVEPILRGGLDDDILTATMTPGEIDRLRAMSPAQGEEPFFLAWTAKEAYSKALGIGLSVPLTEIDALSPLLAGDELRLPGDPLPHPVFVRPIGVREGYCAGLAVEGGIGEISVAQLSWSGPA